MRTLILMVAAGALLSGSAFAAETAKTLGADAPKQTTSSTTTSTTTRTMPAPADTSAAADPMHAMYGNTMTINGPDGQKWKYLFQTDKSYVMLDGKEMVHRGTWDVKNSQLCLTPAAIPTSATAPSTSCHETPKLSGVGDVWSYHGADGKPFTVTLNQGMESFEGATGAIDTPPAASTAPTKPAPAAKPTPETTAPTSPAPGGTIAQ